MYKNLDYFLCTPQYTHKHTAKQNKLGTQTTNNEKRREIQLVLGIENNGVAISVDKDVREWGADTYVKRRPTDCVH